LGLKQDDGCNGCVEGVIPDFTRRTPEEIKLGSEWCIKLKPYQN
jgi:hypothetical protein